MNITKTNIETQPVQERLVAFAASQPDWNSRAVCKNMVPAILNQSVNAMSHHCVADLSAHEECLIEAYLQYEFEGATQAGTIDLILLDHTKKRALIVDWKRVGVLDDAKIWRYSKGSQPRLYVTLIGQAYKDYDVDFEFRFMVGDEARSRPIPVRLGQKALTKFRIEQMGRIGAARIFNGTEWPRNAERCWDYGQLCPFHESCFDKGIDDGSEPMDSPTLSRLTFTSSLIGTFDQCARKYAEILAQSQEEGIDFHDIGQPNKYALWGTMFHLATSEFYKQILEANQPS